MPYFPTIKMSRRSDPVEYHFIEADDAWTATGIAISLGLLERDEPDDHFSDYQGTEKPLLWGYRDEGVSPCTADEMIADHWHYLRHMSPHKVFIHPKNGSVVTYEYTQEDVERGKQAWFDNTPRVHGFVWYASAKGPGNVIEAWKRPGGLKPDEWWDEAEKNFVRRDWSAPSGINILTDGDFMSVTTDGDPAEVEQVRKELLAANAAARKAAGASIEVSIKSRPHIPNKAAEFLKRKFK